MLPAPGSMQGLWYALAHSTRTLLLQSWFYTTGAIRYLSVCKHTEISSWTCSTYGFPPQPVVREIRLKSRRLHISVQFLRSFAVATSAYVGRSVFSHLSVRLPMDRLNGKSGYKRAKISGNLREEVRVTVAGVIKSPWKGSLRLKVYQLAMYKYYANAPQCNLTHTLSIRYITLKMCVKMHRNGKKRYFRFTPWFNDLIQEVYKVAHYKQYWHRNSGAKGTNVMGITVPRTRFIVKSSRDGSNHRSMAYTMTEQQVSIQRYTKI